MIIQDLKQKHKFREAAPETEPKSQFLFFRVYFLRGGGVTRFNIPYTDPLELFLLLFSDVCVCEYLYVCDPKGKDSPDQMLSPVFV